jgi:hypothetical protein
MMGGETEGMKGATKGMVIAIEEMREATEGI